MLYSLSKVCQILVVSYVLYNSNECVKLVIAYKLHSAQIVSAMIALLPNLHNSSKSNAKMMQCNK